MHKHNAPATDRVWIVIPAYNEAPRLPAVLASLQGRFGNIVIVDDGSGDNTLTIAINAGAWCVRHICNCGQGAAIQTGIDFAIDRGAEVIVTMDADGQHCPSDIPKLLQPIIDGRADVCLGSRFSGRAVGIPLSRLVLLKLAVLFTRLTTGAQVTDTHNGLRAFTRQAVEMFRIRQNRMAHASEIIHCVCTHSLRLEEVPVTVRYTEASLRKGQSSWNSLKILGRLLIAKVVG